MPFKLEIHSIEEFLIFVGIIRDKKLDENEVKKLTEQLSKSTNQLDEAVKQNQTGE